jgi:hypothetical protein
MVLEETFVEERKIETFSNNDLPSMPDTTSDDIETATDSQDVESAQSEKSNIVRLICHGRVSTTDCERLTGTVPAIRRAQRIGMSSLAKSTPDEDG